MSTSIERAVKHLSAVELSDGDYAYYEQGMRRWYTTDVHDLELLDAALEGDKDAYSRWCAETDQNAMPEGWTPDAPWGVTSDADTDEQSWTWLVKFPEEA
jgi:hypothetical protein